MESKTKVPWCTCSRGKTDGYTHLGNDLWGCPKCRQPSRMVWEKYVLAKRYEQELDDIITRIINKVEKEDGLDKGRAEIACLFIAMLYNPANPNIIQIRNDAVRRYRERNNQWKLYR